MAVTNSELKQALFLIADTGGGHRAAANAVREAVEHLYPGRLEINIIDLWRRHTPWPINRIGDSYVWMVEDGRWLWKLIWKTDEKPELVKVFSHIVTPPLQRSLSKLFAETQADLIASFHPLMNHIPLRVLRRLGRAVPFATVVTDPVIAHPAWFCPEVQLCTVPTTEARERALRYGMPPEMVVVTGQPVGLKFQQRIGSKKEVRARLGLALDLPTVLVLGGGEGMGPVEKIARAIAARLKQTQMIVVAGRNKELQRRLESILWEIPTRVLGFVDNMPELMRAADVVVTKAGPGTISEAFISGLPIILSGYIPGQEEGNVWYVRRYEAGIYEPEPEKIAALLEEWFRPGNPVLQQMAARAAALARPEASLEIARRLFTLAYPEAEVEAAVASPPRSAL